MRPPLVAVPVSQLNHEGRPLYAINAAYVAALQSAGAVPVLLPVDDPCDSLVAALDACHGLLLTGGGDVSPEFYGQVDEGLVAGVDRVRDLAEIALTLAALDRGLPLLGICRGVQLMAVAAGGALHQDIQTSVPSARDHRYQPGNARGHLAHDVRVEGKSLVAQSTCSAVTGTLDVNSMHHQAVTAPPPGFRVTAWAPDGIIEAIETNGSGHPFVLGVQWHPEELVPQHAAMVSLFGAFAQACQERC